MPLYKSPKSGKLIDVESSFDTETGSDKARDEALSKGWRPVHELVSKSGKTINVDDDGLKEALGKGWQTKDVATAKNAKTGIGAGESFARGAAQGLTFGFADELQAGIQAPLSKKSYSEIRDEYRGADKDADKEQGGAFVGGQVGAGVASLGAGVFGAAKGAVTAAPTVARALAAGAGRGAAVGAGEGALAGVGSAETLKDAPGEALQGALLGGALGGAGGAVGGAIAGKSMGKAGGLTPERLVKYSEAAKGGAKEASQAAQGNILGKIGQGIEGAKGAVRSIKDVRRFEGELQSLGSGKVLGDAPSAGFDPGADLFLAGPSKTKDFVASQAGQLSGNIDPKTYRYLLEKGVDDLVETQRFDPKAAASGLADDLTELQDNFGKARTESFRGAQAQAAKAFDPTKADALSSAVDDKLARAGADDLMPGRSTKVLESVRKDLENVLPGQKFDAAGDRRARGSAEDTFSTLQRIRQKLDDEIEWTSKEKARSGERLLREMRKEVDEVMKSAPGKREADDFFQKSIDVEGGFFGATEFRGADGRMNVDEFKLKRLLGDTDAAGRFANHIDNARTYFQDPRFPESYRTAQLEMLDRIDAARKRYGDKLTMQALRQQEGPSSPAINAKAYLMNRKNLPADSIGAPANDLRSRIEFVEEFVHKAMGKKFSELSPDERTKFAKLYAWRKSNPQSTPEEMQAAVNKMFKSSP